MRDNPSVKQSTAEQASALSSALSSVPPSVPSSVPSSAPAKQYLGRLTNGEYRDLMSNDKYLIGKTSRNLHRLDATAYLILMQYPYRRSYYISHGVNFDTMLVGHNASGTLPATVREDNLCAENE